MNGSNMDTLIPIDQVKTLQLNSWWWLIRRIPSTPEWRRVLYVDRDGKIRVFDGVSSHETTLHLLKHEMFAENTGIMLLS